MKLLWLKQGWESSQDLRELSEKATRLKLKMDIKSGPVIEKLCATHQGAVLFVDGAPTLDLSRLDTFQKSTLVLLDGIEDPHNLGAILRTSWLVGAHGLIIPEDRAVGLTPTAHKVACGGAEHVPVVELTSFANYIEELKKKGYWVFGLSHKATQTIYQFDIPDKVVWAVGAEDRGLRVTTERLCDGLVSIPQLSAAASYNASVAAGMTLGETLRRHSHHGVPKK